MIARARRAFPGVMVSLLLAGPALAAQHAPAQPQPRRTAEPLEHRKAAGKSGALKSASAKSAAAQPGRSRPGAAFAQQQRRRGSYRHIPADQTAFIDDGAAYDPEAHAAPSETRVTTWQQSGLASWYGGSWHGRSTSSGARFDQEELTAAHASLPMGTKVRVVLHDGGRSVVVTINDRPGTRSRVIDLSKAAARELGILDRGVALVTLVPL